MDMHDCPFLVVFDINEDLNSPKLGFSRRGISQLPVRTCFVILGQIFVELQAISQLSF